MLKFRQKWANVLQRHHLLDCNERPLTQVDLKDTFNHMNQGDAHVKSVCSRRLSGRKQENTLLMVGCEVWWASCLTKGLHEGVVICRKVVPYDRDQ